MASLSEFPPCNVPAHLVSVWAVPLPPQQIGIKPNIVKKGESPNE